MRKMPCELITPQSLAHYNALLLIEILKLWLSSPKEVPAEKIFEAYQYIIRTPILDTDPISGTIKRQVELTCLFYI